MADLFDLLVLGGGPGGYVAALRGAQLGLKVCLVEKDALGGVCLNRGCIPSKTLLTGAELFDKTAKLKDWGIEFSGQVRWNVPKLFEKKDAVVARLRHGLETLCQKRKVSLVQGRGVLKGPNEVEVNGERLSARAIILATGSVPRKIDFGVADPSRILTSEEALSLQKIPDSIVIAGGGPEGCEFALIFRALGAKVTLVELKDRLLPGMDQDAGAAIRRLFVSKGIDLFTGDALTTVTMTGTALSAKLKSGAELTAERILLCAGRVPNSSGLGLEALGVACDARGAVLVDAGLKTRVPSISAVGDLTGRFMMAHAASYEGYVTASCLAGKKEALDYSAVPACVYTYPEVAEVGLNEEKAKAQNVPYDIGRFSLAALGRAQAKDATQGFVKIIGHAKTHEILGAVVVGEGASEMINLLTLAVRKKLKVDDLRGHIAPHPSGSEAVVEAAHLFFREGLHFA